MKKIGSALLFVALMYGFVWIMAEAWDREFAVMQAQDQKYREEYKMEMKAVSSSNIAAVGFDGGTLRVQFTNGAQYDYSGVSEELYNQLMAAESIGRFFNQNIKGSYPFQKVG